MTDQIRAAIVGTGGIARAHARALAAHPDLASIVATVDVDEVRLGTFSDEWGVEQRYLSVEEMLRDAAPDLVHICTPPGLHADQAVASLSSGATVLCEKPPSLSLAEFDRIAAAATDGHFVTVFQHRFGSAARHLSDLIAQDALGRPLVAVCNTLWYRGDAYYEVPWRGNWDIEGGGPTLGHGIHQIDLLAHLLGDWTEISAVAPRLARHVETEDVSMALVRFESGAVASIVNSVLSPREESYIRLDFADATVEVTHLYGYSGDNWRVTPAPHVAEGALPWPAPGEDVASSHEAQILDVLNRLLHKEIPQADPASARRTMEIVTGTYASAFTGRTVHRSELVDGNPFYHRLNGETA